MIRPASSVLCSLFALAACASVPEKPAPVAAAALQPSFTYHASVAAVPAGAARLVLSVRIPEPLASDVQPLRAYGLVGNAAFELALPESLGSSNPASQGGSAPTVGPAVLSWRAGQEGGTRYRELVVETRGKPLELSLCLAQLPGAALEASALEQELTRATSASVDGRPLEALSTRLESSGARR